MCVIGAGPVGVELAQVSEYIYIYNNYYSFAGCVLTRNCPGELVEGGREVT